MSEHAAACADTHIARFRSLGDERLGSSVANVETAGLPGVVRVRSLRCVWDVLAILASLRRRRVGSCAPFLLRGDARGAQREGQHEGVVLVGEVSSV